MCSTPIEARLERDPLRFARRFSSPADQEVAAFLAAMLAFGRVELFGAVLERLFAAAEGQPAAFVARGDFRALRGLYYRWHPAEDIVDLCALAGRVTRTGGFERLFSGRDTTERMTRAIDEIRASSPSRASFRRFLPSPRDGSAMKRWCLFLRWMVRTQAPDLGLWRSFSPAALVIPLDTHVFRISRLLGLVSRATPGWSAAGELTAALAKLHPADPLRYDFALAHLGISGDCRARRDDAICPACPLREICVHGR
ncbi:MAG: TIGR02757 family protein [Deltaproteobacteria bacterium]|nr:TIGR02757 family protein [Deltaproteobacteria bacterium]